MEVRDWAVCPHCSHLYILNAAVCYHCGKYVSLSAWWRVHKGAIVNVLVYSLLVGFVAWGVYLHV